MKGAGVMLVAVIIAGGAAGKYVSPLAFPATFAVVAIIVLAMARETRREAIADPVAELPPGQARDLLLAVIVQSRPIFTAPSTTFDPAHETETRNNVSSLVDACRATAGELSAFDVANAGATVDDRSKGARDQLVRRLTDAADALRALYIAGIANGTPASDRVAELVGEIRADAGARGYAKTQLQG